MLSEEYKSIEDQVGRHLNLQAEIAESIARHIKGKRRDVEHALYLACVSTGAKPIDMAMAVNEFLMALDDAKREEEQA